MQTGIGRGGVALLVLLTLMACGGPPVPAAPETGDLSREIHIGRAAPKTPTDACWAQDVAPLVIETVTEQVQVAPEERAPDGTVIHPAAFRSETRQKIVQERSQIWFQAPCPEEFTVAFVASLQRALKARALYVAPVTGVMDGATEAAVRKFQAERGLDSPKLSLAAARQLGLVAGDFDR